MKRTNAKKRVWIASAALPVAVGLAVAGWYVASRLQSRPNTASATRAEQTVVPTSAFAQPRKWPCPISGDFKEADVPVGLLCDYYEHIIEHAPPRDPSGAMQRRESRYAAPKDPFELLAAMRMDVQRGRTLMESIRLWRTAWEAGRALSSAELTALERGAMESDLTSDRLVEAARGLNWLDGDLLATTMFRAGLAKAKQEYAIVRAGDLSSNRLLAALPQTKSLWRSHAWSALRERFELEAHLYPRLSTEARRSGYLAADMLFSEHRFVEAADAIMQVRRDDAYVGDLGLLERSDIDEMTWTTALFLQGARRYKQAVPYWQQVEHGTDRNRGKWATEFLVQAAGAAGEKKVAIESLRSLYRRQNN